jgi:hypothetical protein
MKKLSEELPEGFEASLLAAGRADEPNEERRRKALDAGLAALSASGLGGAAGSVGAGKTAFFATLGWKSILMLGLAVGSAIGVASSVWPVPRDASPPRRSPAPATTPLAPPHDLAPSPASRTDRAARVDDPAPESPPRQGSPSNRPAGAVDDGAHAARAEGPPAAAMPLGAKPTPGGAPTPASNEASPSGPDTSPSRGLGDELSALDEARAELDHGHGDDALRTLDRYDHRHPNGAMGREAELLRVEALVLQGDRAEALRRARALLAANGPRDDLYRARLRRILGDAIDP